MTDPTPTRAEVEAAVEKLANSHLGMSLVEWNAVSNTILACAAENQALRERAEAAEAAIKRQAGAAATLRTLTLSEVQHLKDMDRSEYNAARTLDGEREANAMLTEEVDRLNAALTAARRAEAAAWNDAIEAAGNLESIHGYSNAVPRHRIRALRRAAPTEGEA